MWVGGTRDQVRVMWVCDVRGHVCHVCASCVGGMMGHGMMRHGMAWCGTA